MPRQAREKSSVGIYHIMFRGNNRQNIFIDDEDRMKMIILLENLPLQYDNTTGKMLPSRNCDFYAYCLMTNHVHLLYREMDEDIEHSMKRLLTSYAQYYNGKYARIGHVFQDRYRSEPCNDINYFIQVFRYIHQNPVKANLSNTVAQYKWCSWNEYVNYGKIIDNAEGDILTNVCNVKAILKRYPIENLAFMVNEILPDEMSCLEDRQDARVHRNDDEVSEWLKDNLHICSPSDFGHLDVGGQRRVIAGLDRFGATYRQIVGVSGLSYRQVSKVVNKMKREGNW